MALRKCNVNVDDILPKKMTERYSMNEANYVHAKMSHFCPGLNVNAHCQIYHVLQCDCIKINETLSKISVE